MFFLKNISLRTFFRQIFRISIFLAWPAILDDYSLKGSTPKLKKTNWFLFWFFPGGDRPPPPVFIGFLQGNRFKIGKTYEALTAMVFNKLLWGFAHIFFHPYLMFATSISQFDRRQRPRNDCVFRLFDSSKY